MPVNLAVVQGACSSPVEVRVLPSGSTLAVLQVTTRAPGRPATSVPVAMWGPPGWVDELDSGDEVVVLGQVRRRFFRGAGGTGSRVEVEAVALARARDRRRVQALARRARAALEEIVP